MNNNCYVCILVVTAIDTPLYQAMLSHIALNPSSKGTYVTIYVNVCTHVCGNYIQKYHAHEYVT